MKVEEIVVEELKVIVVGTGTFLGVLDGGSVKNAMPIKMKMADTLGVDTMASYVKATHLDETMDIVIGSSEASAARSLNDLEKSWLEHVKGLFAHAEKIAIKGLVNDQFDKLLGKG